LYNLNKNIKARYKSMNKTRVDDMLIEMIEPKITEINEKFSNGKSLTQDDINTLLLKSQYNHINHLDDKLNETVESVKNLEHKFEKLEQKYESDFKELKSDFENLKQEIETTIQKALNKNMMMLIVVIGLFMTISKIIDKF
jgi:uncharacterized coiled-coil DUF342 family protein